MMLTRWFVIVFVNLYYIDIDYKIPSTVEVWKYIYRIQKCDRSRHYFLEY